jgi:hypothetical protein
MAADEGKRASVPIDAGLGVASPWDETVPAIDVDGIKRALTTLVTKGLPATTAGADQLLDLRSVYARATHPYDPQSRLAALNQLLVRILADRDDDRGEALRIMYGIAAGTRRTSLTHRRDKARAVLGYEQTHFRKDVEPQLIEELATAVYQDLLRYKRRIRRAAEAEEPTGDTPSLGEADLTHEEELISRIWQYVYGLRAELIAVARLGTDPNMTAQVEDHRQAAERARTLLRDLLGEYTGTYGTDLIRHGEAEYQVQSIERLTGGTL